MRRLRRILWNGVTGAALVGCLCCAVLWARCYLTPPTHFDAVILWRVDVSADRAHQRSVRIWSHSGAAHVDYDSNVFRGQVGATPGTAWTPTPWRVARVGSGSILAGGRGSEVLGFRFWFSQNDSRASGGKISQEFRGVSVPYWALTLVLAVLPAVRLWRRRRREADRVAGRCVECGYDLRGTAGRCPECGVVVEFG